MANTHTKKLLMFAKQGDEIKTAWKNQKEGNFQMNF